MTVLLRDERQRADDSSVRRFEAFAGVSEADVSALTAPM